MSLNGSAQSIGSPSRMRGKEGDELGLGQTIRITPAYAGKSKSLPSLHIGSRDHPRACGKKRVVAGGHVEVYRITPACAGKRRVWFSSWPVPWDHPRVCGEKLSTTSTDIHPAGSPSRVRGKADFPVRCREHSRITPACVGKRRKPCRRHAANRDHPRVCGEKDLELYRIMTTKGSPPHVRGKA